MALSRSPPKSFFTDWKNSRLEIRLFDMDEILEDEWESLDDFKEEEEPEADWDSDWGDTYDDVEADAWDDRYGISGDLEEDHLEVDDDELEDLESRYFTDEDKDFSADELSEDD